MTATTSLLNEVVAPLPWIVGVGGAGFLVRVWWVVRREDRRIHADKYARRRQTRRRAASYTVAPPRPTRQRPGCC